MPDTLDAKNHFTCFTLVLRHCNKNVEVSGLQLAY